MREAYFLEPFVRLIASSLRKSMTSVQQIFKYGLFSVFAVVVLIAIPKVIWTIVAELLQKLGAKKWPTAEGTVIRSEVDVTDLCAGIPNSEPEISKYPIVEYSYVADGRTYQSRRFSINGTPVEVDADERVAMYPKGARVEVYYNPTDPADCALDVKINGSLFWRGLIFVTGLLVVGLAALGFLAYSGYYTWAGLHNFLAAPD